MDFTSGGKVGASELYMRCARKPQRPEICPFCSRRNQTKCDCLQSFKSWAEKLLAYSRKHF